MVFALALLAAFALAAAVALAWSCFCDPDEGSPVLAAPIALQTVPVRVRRARYRRR